MSATTRYDAESAVKDFHREKSGTRKWQCKLALSCTTLQCVRWQVPSALAQRAVRAKRGCLRPKSSGPIVMWFQLGIASGTACGIWILQARNPVMPCEGGAGTDCAPSSGDGDSTRVRPLGTQCKVSRNVETSSIFIHAYFRRR